MRCAVEVTPIRAAPSDEAEQVTQALLREPLRVEGRSDGWAHVVTDYDYPGWLRESALEDLPGEFPRLIAGQELAVARMYIGSPYEWGGLTKRGIDCSGLVHMAYRLAGRLIARDAWQQEQAARAVQPDRATVGDLITYGAGERADHIAFWLGEGRILHATARDELGVVAEAEPPSLVATRRRVIRL